MTGMLPGFARSFDEVCPPQPEYLRVLACGSREWADWSTVREALHEVANGRVGRYVTLVHGDCRGADRIAGRIAVDLGWDVRRFPANWAAHGRAAGPIRNRAMLAVRPHVVVAFGEGRGTDDLVGEAERRGIPVRRIA